MTEDKKWNIMPWKSPAPDSGDLQSRIVAKTAHKPGVTADGNISVNEPLAPDAELTVPGRELFPRKHN